jgi:SAM-dependent methyltransferase
MSDVVDKFSWSEFYSKRKEIRRIYPSVFELPIRKKLLDVVVGVLEGRERILDIGAHDRSLGEKITARFPSAAYKSMDTDRELHHDYYSLEEIDDRFDMIVLSEVIEHIEFEEGISLLRKLFELLRNGGRIVVSTPNLHHPNRYWDSDHKTPYRYDEICSALLSVGYNVDEVVRIYNDQFLKRLFRIYVAQHLHRYLDIDFAKSIVVVASKT